MATGGGRRSSRGAATASAGGWRITAPGDIEDVVVTDATLKHVVDGADKYRARYINRLEPTVADPDEVWLVEYVSGDKVEFRRHFLKAWDDKKATFLVAVEDSAGNLSITFMPMSRVREINKRRRGVLLYRRLEEDE